MRSRKFLTYDERFCRFSGSIEKGLIIAISLLLIFLIFSEILLHIETFRTWFVEVDRLEGVAS